MNLTTLDCDDTALWLGEQFNQQLASLRSVVRGSVSSSKGSAMAGLKDKLFNAVLDQDFESARSILHGVDNHVDRAKLLSDVIDRLDIDWQEDRRHVIDTAASYWVIHRLTRSLGLEDTGSLEHMGFSGTILMYVPEEEQHCFGAQILADGLSATGWKVDLKPDCAAVDVLEGVSTKYLDALGVSIGYDKNFIGLADMIQEARIVSKNPSLKVLLGGKAFEEPHSQYDFLGADVILKDVASTTQYLGRLSTSTPSDRFARNAQ